MIEISYLGVIEPNAFIQVFKLNYKDDDTTLFNIDIAKITIFTLMVFGTLILHVRSTDMGSVYLLHLQPRSGIGVEKREIGDI